MSAERSLVNNVSTVLPVDPATGNQVDPVTGNPFGPPFSVFDSNSKAGWLIGTYLQDEWRITNQLTLNAGLRFDQMYQYVDANQLSPRVSLTWKPYDGRTFHVGYARNFTPPQQVIAAPTAFENHSEKALNELLTKKQKGLPITAAKRPQASNVVDLMDALRQSLKPGSASKVTKGAPVKKAPAKKRKAS